MQEDDLQNQTMPGSGVTYKDFEGNTIDNITDFCKFLAENGITHIRVRVWNDPYDANGNGTFAVYIRFF